MGLIETDDFVKKWVQIICKSEMDLCNNCIILYKIEKDKKFVIRGVPYQTLKNRSVCNNFLVGSATQSNGSWVQGRHSHTRQEALSAPGGQTISGTVSPQPHQLLESLYGATDADIGESTSNLYTSFVLRCCLIHCLQSIGSLFHRLVVRYSLVGNSLGYRLLVTKFIRFYTRGNATIKQGRRRCLRVDSILV